jgi:plastocyanin
MKQRIGLLLAVAVLGGSLFASAASASTHAAKAKLVTVTMTDFHFKFTPAGPLPKGTPITFKVVNKGAALHNFDVQGVKASKTIAHGKTTSFTVTFKKAGKFAIVCDVPRHAELGMAGFITVK